MRPLAIVTGASRGIGRGIAIKLAEQGFGLLTFDRTPVERPLKHETFVKLDLAQRDDLGAAVDRIGKLSSAAVLVNNVGNVRTAKLGAIDPRDITSMAMLNLGTTIAFSEAVLPLMRRAGSGRIVNIASRAALGKVGRSVYGATKAGIISMTRTWALELASFGITVNAVAPGPIQTASFDRWNNLGDPEADLLRRSVPVQRLGAPSDVAHAVSFFADDNAGFITGQVVYVCGGLTVGSQPI
jgi:NAD(P)-dependent dehydrogenase (short-subunit alcohol dehydrogenase family)